MPEQKKPIDGTTVIVDPVPDAVLNGTDGIDESDFSYLVTKKPEDDQQKPEKEVADKKIEEERLAKLSDDERKAEQERIEAEKQTKIEQEQKEKANQVDLSKVNESIRTKLAESIRAEFDTKLTESTTRIQQLETELTQSRLESESLKNIQEFKTQLEKEPYVVLQKYFPQIAEKFDPRRAVIEQLKKEFPDFIFDPSEQYNEGSQSYNYRLREEELRDTLRREQDRAISERTQAQQRQAVIFEEARKAVMTERKLTEAGFKDLQDWASKTVITPREWAALKFRDADIKAAVDLALENAKKKVSDKPKGSVAGIHGEDTDVVPETIKDLQETFGDY